MASSLLETNLSARNQWSCLTGQSNVSKVSKKEVRIWQTSPRTAKFYQPTWWWSKKRKSPPGASLATAHACSSPTRMPNTGKRHPCSRVASRAQSGTTTTNPLWTWKTCKYLAISLVSAVGTCCLYLVCAWTERRLNNEKRKELRPQSETELSSKILWRTLIKEEYFPLNSKTLHIHFYKILQKFTYLMLK